MGSPSSGLLWNMVMITSAVANIAIAWSLHEMGTPSLSLQVLSRVIPIWSWPLLFGAVGIVATGGLFSTMAGRVQFYMGSFLMFIWGMAAIYLWFENGVSPVGGIFLMHLSTLKLICAVYADRLRRVHRATTRLQQEVSEVQGLLEESNAAPGPR